MLLATFLSVAAAVAAITDPFDEPSRLVCRLRSGDGAFEIVVDNVSSRVVDIPVLAELRLELRRIPSTPDSATQSYRARLDLTGALAARSASDATHLYVPPTATRAWLVQPPTLCGTGRREQRDRPMLPSGASCLRGGTSCTSS